MLRILFKSNQRYPVNIKLLRRSIDDTFKSHNINNGEVSVVICGERKMKELAQKYLGEKVSDPVHEVLSFPSMSPAASSNNSEVEFVDNQLFGDIVICYPEARKIAIRRLRMMDDVIGELAQHATLHLLGMHHD